MMYLPAIFVTQTFGRNDPPDATLTAAFGTLPQLGPEVTWMVGHPLVLLWVYHQYIMCIRTFVLRFGGRFAVITCAL